MKDSTRDPRSLGYQLDAIREASESPTDQRERLKLFNRGKRLARVLVSCRNAELKFQGELGRLADAFPGVHAPAYDLVSKNIEQLRSELYEIFSAEIAAEASKSESP